MENIMNFWSLAHKCKYRGHFREGETLTLCDENYKINKVLCCNYLNLCYVPIPWYSKSYFFR